MTVEQKEVPTGRGGWRGGGRPKGKKVTASITIRGTQAQVDAIRQQAAEKNTSLSRFCIEKLLA